MSLKALDCDAPIDPALVIQNGCAAIGRYQSMTRAELDAYTAAHLWVWMFFELSTSDVLGGESAGAAHAAQALQAIASWVLPKGTVVTVFFACDTDPAGLPGGPSGAVPYWRGASAVRQSGHRCGAYISASGANALLDAGVVDRICIPNAPAWADGQTAKRIDIEQGPQELWGNLYVDYPDAVYTTDCLFNATGNYPDPQAQEDPVRLFICTDVPADVSRAQLVAGNTRLGLNPAETAKWEAFCNQHGEVFTGAYWKDLVSALPLQKG